MLIVFYKPVKIVKYGFKYFHYAASTIIPFPFLSTKRLVIRVQNRNKIRLNVRKEKGKSGSGVQFVIMNCWKIRLRAGLNHRQVCRNQIGTSFKFNIII